MLLEPGPQRTLLACGAVLLGSLCLPLAARAQAPQPDPAHPATVEAEFRGCQAVGWCQFQIDALDPTQSVHRVRPDGVVRTQDSDAIAVAVRNRLNALLAGMIHQHKRILLHDLRALEDGTFAAAVTVNGANVASDPMLLELRGASAGTMR
jgi:hypothetical protein